MVFNQISQPRQRVSLRIAFSELDALSGSKTSGCTTSPHLRFSNHGRLGGSQTQSLLQHAGLEFSNHGRSGGSQTPVLESLPNISSATVTDRAVLKLDVTGYILAPRSATVTDRAVLKPVGVDMPFDLGISISKNCKICQVFLFLRPARSFFRSGSRISASVYSRPDGGMGTL